MRPLKIKFVDFWYGFNPSVNYFFNVLSMDVLLELSEEPELLIYSCFGFEHLKYDCIKLFYTGENIRPDFLGCDFALSFDHLNDARHFRFPLYGIYIDQAGSIEKLIHRRSYHQAEELWKSKSKFCCMVVSNKDSLKRLSLFDKLSGYKNVDSGGRVYNNIGGPVGNKMDFIKDYRFVIAFENQAYPGYTTEKIVEPLLAGCIPLYWGNPTIEKDFNPDCFLNLHENKSVDEFVAEIKDVDNNKEKAIKILMSPVFQNDQIPEYIDKDKLRIFFKKVVDTAWNGKSVSKTWKKYGYWFRLKGKYYLRRLKGMLQVQITKN